MAKISKNMKKAYEGREPGQLYSLADAIKDLQGLAKARKFDETLEVAMNLGVDPRHADQTVRGVVLLPHGTGQKLRVAVMAKDAKADEAKKAGADVVGLPANQVADDLKEGLDKRAFHLLRASHKEWLAWLDNEEFWKPGWRLERREYEDGA